MRFNLDPKKIEQLSTVEELFTQEYGTKGSSTRETFDAKARAWYYAEILKQTHEPNGFIQ